MDGDGVMEFSAALCHCDTPFAYLFSMRQFAPALSPCKGDNAAAAPPSRIVAAIAPLRWLFPCLLPPIVA